MFLSQLAPLSPERVSDHDGPRSYLAHVSSVDRTACQSTPSNVYVFMKQRANNMFYCSWCSQQNEVTAWKKRSTSNFRNHLRKNHPNGSRSKRPRKCLPYHFGLQSALNKRKRINAKNLGASDQYFADD